MQKGLVWSLGGIFSISCMLASKNRVFKAYFLNGNYPMCYFVDKLRAEPTIVSMEKISISLKFLSGHYYGQSFIKTVRGV